MRPRAEAQILLHRPVFQVVARCAPRPGKVGDLVLPVARLLEQSDCRKIFLRLRVVIRDEKPVLFEKERRALFDLEPIAGQMLGLQSDGRPQVFPPARRRLLRQAVNQVEAQVVKARCAGGAHGLDRLAVRVDASDQAQLVVARGLHPERNAVEARAPELPQRRCIARAVGIRLGRDLGAFVHVVMGEDRFQNAAQPVRAEIARRAAAEVDRVNGMVPRVGRAPDQIAPQRRSVSVHLFLRVRQ